MSKDGDLVACFREVLKMREKMKQRKIKKLVVLSKDYVRHLPWDWVEDAGAFTDQVGHQ
jgi:hypothetical protein